MFALFQNIRNENCYVVDNLSDYSSESLLKFLQARYGFDDGGANILQNESAKSENGQNESTKVESLRIENSHLLYITDDENISVVSNFFKLYTKNVCAYESWDSTVFDFIKPSREKIAFRLNALAKIIDLKDLIYDGKNSDLNGQIKQNNCKIIVTSIKAIMQKTIPVEFLIKNSMKIANDLEVENFGNFLCEIGYQKKDIVENYGDFAVKGDMIEVFTPSIKYPIRIDFFSNVVEKIRYFDVYSQKTLGSIDDFLLIPISELILNSHTFDNFEKKYKSIFKKAVTDFYCELRGGRLSQNDLNSDCLPLQRLDICEHFLPLFYDKLDTFFDYFFYNCTKNRIKKNGNLDIIFDNFDVIFDTNCNINLQMSKLYNDAKILYLKRSVEKKEILADADDFFDLKIFENLNANVLKLQNFDAILGCKFSNPTLSLNPEIYAKNRHGNAAKKDKIFNKKKLSSIYKSFNLMPNDYVVHKHQGIGRYCGIEKIAISSYVHDCVVIEYADNDRLYLPVENLELLARYASCEAEVVLDKLGGTNWHNRKEKVQKRIREMMDTLIHLSAKREILRSQIIVNKENFDQFTNEFKYIETQDQLSAIHDVISDLESQKLMDRIICADVGYGKTEVALRAAFLVVNSGFQVAYVCPTTILCKQIYEVFQERFSSVNFTVRQISSFVSLKEKQQIKSDLKNGKINILIGTHAIFASDLDFFNIGMLIIDEEQSFGVKQKELLKKKYNNINILSLSATPIPRTMQFVLSGLKDISLIMTAPINRKNISQHVLNFDETTIISAINNELQRNGQVFIVAPRIEFLGNLYDFICKNLHNLKNNKGGDWNQNKNANQNIDLNISTDNKIVADKNIDANQNINLGNNNTPADQKNKTNDIVIEMAHGKLPSYQLENIISNFVHGKVDILISTNIIESGMDIPNANTMIVYKAEMFGLAQLYQLKGRVGRSEKQAYVYFLTHFDITNKAKSRINILERLKNNGICFELANYDLEMRGGGNLLGKEQSGHIREIGFEMYQEMLEKAVVSLSQSASGSGISGESGNDGIGKSCQNNADCQSFDARSGSYQFNKMNNLDFFEVDWSSCVNLMLSTYIDESYISDIGLRLNFYRRISDACDKKALDEIANEMLDRFGKLPVEVANLLKVVDVKNQCKALHIEKFDAGPNGITLTFKNIDDVFYKKIVGLAQKYKWKVRPDGKLFILENINVDNVYKVASGLLKFLDC